MKRNCFITSLMFLFLMGCTSVGTFSHTTRTTVDLSKRNYHIVKPNAIGKSTGFKFLGIIPIVSPRYTKAMTNLYSKAGVAEGRAMALANVVEERSSIYLILFSLPKLTIRADVIEFVE